MSDSTETVQCIHRLLKQEWAEGERIPTRREMAAHCDVSLSTIQDVLSILEAQGHIVRQRYKTRGIRLVEHTPEPATDETAETILSYIEECVSDGVHPTQTEIADELYLSRREVRRCVLWLEAQGRVKRVNEQWQLPQ
ncbi:MAG: GntR family transcriptional regulator [Chloroflexota bacterium]